MLFQAFRVDPRSPCGGRMLARVLRIVIHFQRHSSGSDTPQRAAFAARRIGSEPLVRWGFALGYRFVYSVCFAQTAALQREGRAPCEKNRGHVR